MDEQHVLQKAAVCYGTLTAGRTGTNFTHFEINCLRVIQELPRTLKLRDTKRCTSPPSWPCSWPHSLQAASASPAPRTALSSKNTRDELRDDSAATSLFIDVGRYAKTTKQGFKDAKTAKLAQDAAKLSDDQAATLSKIMLGDSQTLEAIKVSDDEVAEMTGLVKKANAGDGVGLTDDEVVKFAEAFAEAKKGAGITDDQVSKLAKMLADGKKIKEVAKVSDDEVTKVSEMFKKINAGANGAKYTDEDVAKLSKALAAAQKGAALSDDQLSKLTKLLADAKQITSIHGGRIGKVSQELAEVAKQDKKSWSAVKKAIVAVLGVSVGGAIIYGVYKLTTSDASSSGLVGSTTLSGLSGSA